jgi:transcriptional regulator with XRE-family HTH domain
MTTNAYKYRNALGDTIRANRLEQRRTLRSVAEAAAIALGYLSELENGRKEASSEILECIAHSLDVPAYQLVVEAGYRLADLNGALEPSRIFDEVLV